MMRFTLPLLALLLILAGLLASAPGSHADTCRFTTCGARERMLGTKPIYQDPGGRGYGTWNDIYNQRNPQPTITAKPFDLGSPVPKRKPGDFNLDHPKARNLHMRWCLNHYRSYDGVTNSYMTYDGRTLYCNSPYD